MRSRSARLLAVALVAAAGAGTVRAQEATDPARDAIVKPIDRMIKLIRFEKYAQASEALDYEAMARALLADTWPKMAPEQRQELVQGVAYLTENLSFPKVRAKLEALDDIFYADPVVDGDSARVRQTIVVHRDLKKEEIAIEYLMRRSAAGWRILDVIVEGESTLEGIREDQVDALLEEGGVPLLLERLRAKVAEVREERAAEKR